MNATDASTASGEQGERPVIRAGLPVALVISAFILFHIAATVLWIMPKSALKDTTRPLAWNYISHAGLWQHWGMFAPEPSSLNYALSGIVTYQDGSQREWVWPRMGEYNAAERYQLERYRKFSEYARMDRFSGIWPSMARFIAQENDDNPANPPVHVQLVRSWWFVPEPTGDLSREPEHSWSRYQFFETAITTRDLQP